MAAPKLSATAGTQTSIEFFKKQLAGESPLTFRTAKHLFELATTLLTVRPWQFLNDQDLVLLKNPLSNEFCFCSVMGALGEVISLHAYAGDESYRFFKKMAAGGPISIGEFYGSLRGVYVEFVGLSQLTPPDRELARAFGHPLKRGSKPPIFRALRPGYYPWYVTEEEGIVLDECIQAVLDFCEHMKDDPQDYWKKAGIYPSMVPMQTDQDRKRFGVEMAKVPESPAAVPVPVKLDQNRVREVLDRKHPTRGIFETEHFYGGGMMGKSQERKACVRMCLVADANTGFVFPPELGTPERLTSEMMATALINAIEVAGYLPSEIRVNCHQCKMFLEPLEREFRLKVTTVKHLPALQEAKEQLLTMMGDPGAFVA